VTGVKMVVPASDVQEGDFLFGGQVYVIENAEEVDGYENRVDVGRHYSVPSDGTHVIITFNDNDGEEGYVVMVGSSNVEVNRGAPV
jgi:hypothetical protein